MRATVHRLNDKWLAVPELSCDLLFGICRPNEYYIEENGLEFINKVPEEKLREGAVVVGKIVGVSKFEFQYFEE